MRLTPAQYRLIKALIERGAYEAEVSSTNLFAGPHRIDNVRSVTLDTALEQGLVSRVSRSDHRVWWQVTEDGYRAALDTDPAATLRAVQHGIGGMAGAAVLHEAGLGSE